MARKNRTRAEWLSLCEEHARSGETSVAFARSRGIHPGTFAASRARLRREASLVERHGADFIEIVTEPNPKPDRSKEVVVVVGQMKLMLSKLPPVAWLAELSKAC